MIRTIGQAKPRGVKHSRRLVQRYVFQRVVNHFLKQHQPFQQQNKHLSWLTHLISVQSDAYCQVLLAHRQVRPLLKGERGALTGRIVFRLPGSGVRGICSAQLRNVANSLFTGVGKGEVDYISNQFQINFKSLFFRENDLIWNDLIWYVVHVSLNTSVIIPLGLREAVRPSPPTSYDH